MQCIRSCDALYPEFMEEPKEYRNFFDQMSNILECYQNKLARVKSDIGCQRKRESGSNKQDVLSLVHN